VHHFKLRLTKNVVAQCDFLYIPKCVFGWSLPQTILGGGAYSASPNPVAGCQGAALWQGRIGEGRREREGDGAFPHFKKISTGYKHSTVTAKGNIVGGSLRH